MADSDDEFERKKGRDKFRRERNDYDRRSDDRRRDNWDDRRPSARGNQRGGWRGNTGAVRRDVWAGRGNNNNNVRDRRDMYTRPYDDGRRERLSPGRYDSNPAKRMRRDWEDTSYPGGMYESPFQVSNGPPGADRAGWSHRGMEMSSLPPDRATVGYGDRRDNGGPDYPTQPAMMTFKQFLNKQDDTISQEESIKLYGEYKLEFQRQRINEFFLAHKEEEWFKSKYHPDECEKQQTQVKQALQTRKQVFVSLRDKQFFDDVSVDVQCTDKLIKILDATVILLEGGNDLDLTTLDNPLQEQNDLSRQTPDISVTLGDNQIKMTDDKKTDVQNGEDGELSDSSDKKDADDKDAAQEKTLTETLPLDVAISTKQEDGLKEKAIEYQHVVKPQKRTKKNLRQKSDYSYESDSGSESDSEPDTELVPPGLEIHPNPPTPPPPTPAAAVLSVRLDTHDLSVILENDNKNVEKENAASEVEKGNETDQKPRPLHRTFSIFLRNLAPTITKQEVEALCKRFPGFKRAALQDPQAERRFFRRGWVTFSEDCNIKEVCWSLNNIRLRDCELGATLNRELKVRIRAANGITVHKQVMRNDIKIAAKIIQILDQKYSLWEDPEDEKKDEEKELQFGFVSKNPVLKNITDYLVEEGSFEEDELIGEADDDKKDTNADVTVDKDESLSQALDRMVLYLRLVHSVDYYNANEYPNEDEMPHRCGLMHARGTPPGSTAKIVQNDVNEWISSFEKKIKPFLETTHQISDTEAVQLGKKDPDAEVEKFVLANTQEISKDKWLCPLSGKKFKGPDFVRKHIFSKHQEKVEEVKREVKFFNSYLVDPKRPSLPEHPSNKRQPAPPSTQSQLLPGQQQRTDSYSSYNAAGNLAGFGAARPTTYAGATAAAAAGAYQSNFSVRDTRPPPEPFRRSNYGGAAPSFRRSDPRQLIQYTDLDVPDDGNLLK
uniref:Arsenite-resistance protein 2 homolog n=2 Tax=Arion vulgaris TaxID=1028688 RepID=A0A0B7B5L3_9EUPU